MLGHSCRALHNSSAMKQQPRDTGRGFSRGWLHNLAKKNHFPSVLMKRQSFSELPRCQSLGCVSPHHQLLSPNSSPCIQHVEQSCSASTSEISLDFPAVCYSLCFTHHDIINPAPTARKCSNYTRPRAGSELY